MIKKRNENERIRKVILPAIIFFVLIILIMPAAQNAWSQQGRIYSGDGSRMNPTVPPGGWIFPQGSVGSCLTCHNPGVTSMFNRTVPDITPYLMTGHKNVLRSAQTPPIPIAGTAGTAYTTDEAGNVFNWTNNTIDVLGFCSNSTTADQGVCSSGGGVWISGTKSLYYILGGWMLEPAAPLAVFDGSYNQGTQTAISYGCGRCHTTGYSMDLEPVVNRSPEAGFRGISWTSANTSGKVDFDPDGDGPALSGSWAVDGVTCERCHDATNHMNGGPTIDRGASATALCLNCHRQEHTLPYAGGGLGSNIVPTPYTDNGSLPASEPLHPVPAIEVGGYSGYALQFYGYSTGNEFLNGAHGKFTGNFQQLSDPSKYASAFSAYEDPDHPGVGTGCTTCHDVHQSTVKAVNAEAPFKKDCSDCHADKVESVQTRMTHRPGQGRPLGDCAVEDINCACKLCHMPRMNQRSTAATHIFRVNTDAGYSTFPTETQWNAGQKTATPSPDGNYANAVWLDVDIVCGQCHVGGGGSGYTEPPPWSPGPVSKEALAAYASGIHNDAPIVSFGYTDNGLTLNVNASASSCVSSNPCDEYIWNWGDGSTDHFFGIATASHDYAASGTYSVTLTVVDAGNSTSASKTVSITMYTPDYPPTASHSNPTVLNPDTWVATIADSSTDDHGIALVKVNWGDGTTQSSGAQGTVFTHTYTTTGLKTITHEAIDTIGQGRTETVTVNPATFTIIGNVYKADGTTPVSSAMVKAVIGTSTITVFTNSSGAFSVTNRKPGTYDLLVSRSGYVFNVPAATVTVGPSSAGTNVIAVSP